MEEKRKQYSKTVLILLTIFLGRFGVHHFLVGNVKRGFLYLVPQISAIVGLIVMYIGNIEYLSLVGFILILSAFLSFVIFILIIIDIVKIAQGTFLTSDGYPAVEGN